MIVDPTSKVAPHDLNKLISELDVQFMWLTHCLVSPGYRLKMGGLDFPGIHYNLKGRGRLLIEGYPPVELHPHTLIVVPNNHAFCIEVYSENRNASQLHTVVGDNVRNLKHGINQFVAGSIETAEINLICGFFKASYGQAIDLFSGLRAPIIETFDNSDRLGERLKNAVAEFLGHEVGSDVMSAMLLKQVIILLLRRSLAATEVWFERFSILRDARIAKVMAVMTADPGEAHTVKTLADIACMSRSRFMTTFTAAMDKTPMAVLRELRMRHAASLLVKTNLTIDEISRQSGYQSKSSFIRVFKDTFGKQPYEFRAESAE